MGISHEVRSDQSPGFIAFAISEWIAAVGAKTTFIEKARPRENGYVESFDGKLRDELLSGEIYSLAEARALAAALQHDPAALRAGLSPTDTRRRAAPVETAVMRNRTCRCDILT